MTEITLREVSDATLAELQRRAQQNHRDVNAEASAILEEFLIRERYRRLVKEQGFASAMKAIGREFNITDEFDSDRHPRS